jgi:peptidoglycan biosynthesis protein MviN/MurJ (putative lipid II flippase)
MVLFGHGLSVELSIHRLFFVVVVSHFLYVRGNFRENALGWTHNLLVAYHAGSLALMDATELRR